MEKLSDVLKELPEGMELEHAGGGGPFTVGFLYRLELSASPEAVFEACYYSAVLGDGRLAIYRSEEDKPGRLVFTQTGGF